MTNKVKQRVAEAVHQRKPGASNAITFYGPGGHWLFEVYLPEPLKTRFKISIPAQAGHDTALSSPVARPPEPCPAAPDPEPPQD